MNKWEFDEIRERCEKATPGEWEVKTNKHPETTGELWGWVDGTVNNWCWSNRRKHSRADAEFIAHAKTDIPLLLAEIDRLRAERDAAVADLSGHCEYCVFRSDCAKHDNNDSDAGFTWWTDCEDWEWRGLEGGAEE